MVVFHYHDRPGGVRGVITRGLPALAERLGGVSEVVLLAGELTDTAWLGELARGLGKIPLRTESHGELARRCAIEFSCCRIWRTVTPAM